MSTVYKMLSGTLLSRLCCIQRKLLCIIAVDFNATGKLLIIYFAFIKYLIKKKLEYNEALHQLFIDFKKALINPLNPELNPICYLLALLGAHHFFHVSRIRVKLLTFRLLMSYIYRAPIPDVSRSHTIMQHSR